MSRERNTSRPSFPCQMTDSGNTQILRGNTSISIRRSLPRRTDDCQKPPFSLLGHRPDMCASRLSIVFTIPFRDSIAAEPSVQTAPRAARKFNARNTGAMVQPATLCNVFSLSHCFLYNVCLALCLEQRDIKAIHRVSNEFFDLIVLKCRDPVRAILAEVINVVLALESLPSVGNILGGRILVSIEIGNCCRGK